MGKNVVIFRARLLSFELHPWSWRIDERAYSGPRYRTGGAARRPGEDAYAPQL